MLGKIFGGMASGFLDKIGLGKIAPFVKMGLNAITGNWIGVAKDVFSLISNFKGNPLEGASSQPPLGGFQQPSAGKTPLSANRMDQILDMLKQLIGGEGQKPGMNKIFDLLETVKGIFDNFNQFGTQSTQANFANMKV